MRAIGQLQDARVAAKFNDILCAQGIAAEVERAEGENWTIWVKADDDCPRAMELLRAFRENPAAEQFRQASNEAQDLREKAAQDQASYERRVRQTRKSFASLKGYGFGFLTYVLIFISAVVFVLTKFARDLEPVNDLWFSNHHVAGPIWERVFLVPELRQGQLWRLITPIFIHLGILHIVFNMLWLADLGSMIESRLSSWLLARLVIVIAIGSNAAQFAFTGRGEFGGMSGVVYGLIGYIWIRGKFDPASGVRLHSQTVTTAIIWFFFCFTQYAGPIANAAHAAGLLMGMAWGWLASRQRA